MPTLDIDRDAAHDAAQRELSKPIYPRASLTDRITDWLDDLIYRITVEGASIPGGWLTLSVLLILVVIAVVVAIRLARRTMRTQRARDAAVFAGHDRTAAEHRAAAEESAARGDWSAAIRHRLRAVARHLEDTGVLLPVPGRTATELARDTAAALPALTDEMRRAAEAFNDVTYGARPGTEAAYRVVADLDDHLRTRPSGPGGAAAAGSTQGWAEVR
ncbi:DUF4129 domain-containing protein [Mycolicibacterium grossiae]|uniref:Protein-glutamine gamma-glutamyltransferase-like C-terminal domain-containing protein n=1 Tax=Mycolicibacterium grossiae TaxID=1552759 RepID=A0A1E8Q5I7_9MYCO|nr:DUF4129 domain-containing protein [Mycolicibacterium grossiae]OFJ53511.1 hypothetical protein BEL07_12255 [Mycolicibacterium grossiae]QEM43998.1 DUF4129 domain-containing protein [Mycolicibacterium grossiae]